MHPRLSSVPRAAVSSLAAATLTACAGRLPAPARPTVPTPDEALSARAATVTDADLSYLRARSLLLPVANVRAASLSSSFLASRDGGARAHEGIDILAPRGTPVLAADDGRVWTVRSNALGGLTVYTVDPAERLVFYYAHLDRYQPGLVDGMPVLKGDTLGFVGTTGNSPPDTPHLHFQVGTIGPDHHWWTATWLDPFPFLRETDLAVGSRNEPAVVPVVPVLRVRRPTVPVDTFAIDSTARQRGPRGQH